MIIRKVGDEKVAISMAVAESIVRSAKVKEEGDISGKSEERGVR